MGLKRQIFPSRSFFLSLLGLLVLLPSAFLRPVLAAPIPAEEATTERLQIFPPPEPPELPPGVFGQDHYYTVNFRGNGEAIVSLKLVFTNPGDTPLSSLTLRVPKVDPREAGAFQVLRERVCALYKAPAAEGEKAAVCEQYREPDYYEYWYGPLKYQKAPLERQLDTLQITLPQKVKPNASGSLVLYFRASGYAHRNLFGAYSFTFETLKIEDRIRRLQVGITADSDLHLRGAKGKVNYYPEEVFGTLKTTGVAQEMASPRFDTFYRDLGRGTLVKEASSLQALESYSVKGSFADSRLKLYGREITMIVVAVLLLAGVFFFLARLVLRQLRKASPAAVGAPPSSANLLGFLAVLGLSFLSSLFIAGYSLVLVLVNLFLNSLYYLYELKPLLTIFLILLSLGVYALLFLAPAIWLAIKKGVFWGVGFFVLTFAWLLLYLFLLVLILIFAHGGGPSPIPLFNSLRSTLSPQPVK